MICISETNASVHLINSIKGREGEKERKRKEQPNTLRKRRRRRRRRRRKSKEWYSANHIH